MSDNIFEKVDRQGEQISKIEEGQQEILEMLQKMQRGAVPPSGAKENSMAAEMEHANQRAALQNFFSKSD